MGIKHFLVKRREIRFFVDMNNSLTFPFRIKLDVQWGEMDALGHVNNANYFKYFEAARIQYFEKMSVGEITNTSETGPILATISCQYKRAVSYPDQLTVAISVVKIGNTSLQMDYQVYSKQLDGIAATGSSVVVWINYGSGEKIAITDAMKRKISGLEGKDV